MKQFKGLQYLIATLLLVAAGSAMAQPATPRFSEDAIDLFLQITQGYELNGRLKPAGKMDNTELTRLKSSNDPQVQRVASMVNTLQILKELTKQQQQREGEAIQEQAAKLPGIFAGELLSALVTPPDERNDILSAANMVEKMMGTQPQIEVNKSLSFMLFTQETALATKSEIRTLALRGGPIQASSNGKLSVTISTSPAQMGNIKITNTSGHDLHHCLVFTRLEMDKARIQAESNLQDLFGVLISSAVGISNETIAGSQEASNLSTRINKLDKGTIVYVGYLPAGATVTASVASPSYYLMARSASISLYSDELAVEGEPVSNWKAVLTALQPPRPPSNWRGTNWFGRNRAYYDKHREIGRPLNRDTFHIFIGSEAEGPEASNVKSYIAELTSAHPELKVRYFSQFQQAALIAYVKSLPRGSQINLIGHNFGGTKAADIAATWSDIFGGEQNLIGLFQMEALGLNRTEFVPIRNNTPVWVAVESVPTPSDAADNALWNKMRWRETARKLGGATYIKANNTHLYDLGELMINRGERGDQMSVQDMLLLSSQK